MRIGFTLDVPEMLVASVRLHNKILREELRTILEDHGKRRLPKHFRPLARTFYGYAPRVSKYGRASYDTWKRRKLGHADPLVKSGSSRSYITNPSNQKITVAGSGAEGTLRGSLRTRFPWKGGTGKTRLGGRAKHGATPKVLVSEIERFHASEVKEINEMLKNAYIRRAKEANAVRVRAVRSNVS